MRNKPELCGSSFGDVFSCVLVISFHRNTTMQTVSLDSPRIGFYIFVLPTGKIIKDGPLGWEDGKIFMETRPKIIRPETGILSSSFPCLPYPMDLPFRLSYYLLLLL